MEKNKAQELRDLSLEELDAQYHDTRQELYHLRNKRRQENKLDKPHQIWLLRKNIARYQTVLREKQAQKEREDHGTNS